jgi:EamA-like transporter family
MIGHGLSQGERFGRWQLVGLALAVGGLAILVLPGLSAPSVAGSLLMLSAGFAWGIYSLRGRTVGDPIRVTAGNFLRAVPLAALLSLTLHDRITFDARGIGCAAASGALISGGGYVLWYAALPAWQATQAATLQLSVPVLAAIGGVPLLGEDFSCAWLALRCPCSADWRWSFADAQHHHARSCRVLATRDLGEPAREGVARCDHQGQLPPGENQPWPQPPVSGCVFMCLPPIAAAAWHASAGFITAARLTVRRKRMAQRLQPTRWAWQRVLNLADDGLTATTGAIGHAPRPDLGRLPSRLNGVRRRYSTLEGPARIVARRHGRLIAEVPRARARWGSGTPTLASSPRPSAPKSPGSTM